MNAQQLYDLIIKPTHEYMGDGYHSKNASFLSLCTAAIESNCGEYVKQIGGPALGVWQMEPKTESDIWMNCDALNHRSSLVEKIIEFKFNDLLGHSLCLSPLYACAMARLKYAMDTEPLPDRNNLRAVYDYYKRIYNTELGASTWPKFKQALINNKILEIKL